MSGQGSRNPYLTWYQQHKTLVWGAAAAAATLYATYKVASSSTSDHAPNEQRARRQQSQFMRFANMLKNYSSAAYTLAETVALVSDDLRVFLSSDSTELPQSLRQLNKLLQAPELQETISAVSASVVRGVSTATQGAHTGPPLVDTIIEAVLSDRGRGLIGMAIGVATRNATTSVCEFVERRMEVSASGSSGMVGIKDILDLLSSDQGEKIVTLFLTQSIRTAVTSYVDSTSGYNLYDDMLASIAKQEHRDALTDLLSRITASFCREAVLAYRRAAAAGSTTAAFSPSTHAAYHATKHAPAAGSCATSSNCSLNSTVVIGRGECSTGPCGAAGTSSVPVAASCSGSDGSSLDGRAGGGAVLPLVKSNGQVAAGYQNGRPSQSFQLNKSYGASGSAGSNTAAALLSRGLLSQPPAPWLRQVVELVRERDVRSLAVDVVKCASREATRGAVEGLLQSSGSTLDRSAAGTVLVVPAGASGYKLYIMATLAVTLCMYALSPRVMLL